MSIIDVTGRKSFKIRWLIILMYIILIALGITMVYPFLITMTASVATPVDYYRYDVMPKWISSREDKFVRALIPYFPDGMRGGMELVPSAFTDVPINWTNWQEVGKDREVMKRFAANYLRQVDDNKRWPAVQAMAADYYHFTTDYSLDDMICTFDSQDVPRYYRQKYLARARAEGFSSHLDDHALDILSKDWGVPFASFFEIGTWREMNKAMDQPRFYPPQDSRAIDFLQMQQAYRDGQLVSSSLRSSWVKFAKEHQAPAGRIPFPVTEKESRTWQQLWDEYLAQKIPLSNNRPFILKPVWLSYLGSPQARLLLGLPEGGAITPEEYNKTFHTNYSSLRDIPFPPALEASAELDSAWQEFVQTRFPLRLIELRLTTAIEEGFRTFVQARFKGSLELYNEIIGSNLTSWNELHCSKIMPNSPESAASLWMDYVSTLPFETKIIHSADSAYQEYLLKKYGSLEKINDVYQTNYQQLEQLAMPLDAAYLVTFNTIEPTYTSMAIKKNYSFVFEYLVLRGRSVFNTFVLVLLTLLGSLTVNPLAAYALSRFQMKQSQSVILFLLATMAFPAAVTMIPGYLLMRDLHLLNTYWALILPGLANGMGIFLLKGFFDSLPAELYEAAALDGCPEWVTFLRITLPLSKPILAVTALNSFIAAYNGWEWALIVCQKQEMWTLSVWLYQFNALYAGSLPWTVMASFLIASVPTLLVFLFCQNIILRGIILPQMK